MNFFNQILHQDIMIKRNSWENESNEWLHGFFNF